MREYYFLVKPGIVRGNLFTALAGFFLASRGSVDVWLLIALLVGVAGVISSACVFNNFLDRKIDAKMARTQKRGLITGKIGAKSALLFAAAIGLLGFLTLLLFSSTLSFVFAVIGFVFYVLVYGYFKRKTHHGTLIGSISGAMPPVIGYTAVTNSFDIAALLLFLILVFWQMPHFYAIGIFRKKDYESADIPVLPITHGLQRTRTEMVMYGLSFLIACSLLTIFGYTSYLYLFLILAATGYWVITIMKENEEVDVWAKKVFIRSITVLTIFCIVISLDFAFPF